MTRNELECFDMDMMNEFSITNMVSKIQANLNSEIMNMKMFEEVAEKEINNPIEVMFKLGKMNNNQNERMQKMVNPNAFYKHMAYSSRLEKEMEDKGDRFRKAIGNENDYHDNFQNVYLGRLHDDMKRKDSIDYDNYAIERKKTLHKSLGQFQEPVYTFEDDKIEHTEEIAKLYRDNTCNLLLI